METENKQYLTNKGLQKLEQELENLKNARDIKKKDEAVIPSSQTIDSEFATFQEDLNLLEARIDELESILKNYVLIVLPPTNRRKIVDLGATVILEVEGQKTEFTIVGSIEANPTLGRISHRSPVGNSLLGSKAGDEVRVQSAVKTIYKIKKIIYKQL
ncbi:GreA/GreB family elongation factor [Patescibacteria group bacterium]|nr:GreA/GreB family elongation factor [Patescibacteria group bacterium]MBU4022868.1 GreA/GreB family elongation factor [Patescibacteria group bacterium]MBU4078122.1 GreA/GreB family elongation factor [Patescibacteria group bacterium]